MYLKDFTAAIESFIAYLQVALTSGQSYKQFMFVIYDSRVIWGIYKSSMTLESYITIVEAYIRLATGVDVINKF